MAITVEEFKQALGRFLSLQPVDTNAGGEVTVVTVEIDGVHGGNGGKTGRRRMRYRLLIDIASLHSQLPTVWVLSPADKAIAHANIFRAAPCPVLGRPYPFLCWGTYPQQWAAATAGQRTLLTLLENVLQHLNHPNFASRAQ